MAVSPPPPVAPARLLHGVAEPPVMLLGPMRLIDSNDLPGVLNGQFALLIVEMLGDNFFPRVGGAPSRLLAPLGSPQRAAKSAASPLPPPAAPPRRSATP